MGPMTSPLRLGRVAGTAAVVLALAVAAASCSAEESSSPATASLDSTTLPTTTTTTVAPSTTTTTVAPTTLPTTTTTVPPTTTPPPSGIPTDGTVPVFAGSELGSWLYVGRWNGSGWDGAFDEDGAAVEPVLASNASVTIHDLVRGAREGSSGAFGESCFDGRVGPGITPTAGAPDVPGYGYSAIALQADWPLVPRPVAQVDADVASYAEAGVRMFADDDVETQAGEIDQIVVSDLDGDGDSESLVVFGDESEGEGGGFVDPGFSGLLLIDADSGAAITVVKDFIPLAATQVTTTTDPATGEAGAAPAPTFELYRVLDVVDLNGDGLMEIVVHVWDDDGAGITVWSYDGETVTDAVSTGCGV